MISGVSAPRTARGMSAAPAGAVGSGAALGPAVWHSPERSGEVPAQGNDATVLSVLVLLFLLIAAYPVLRFGGRLIEGDALEQGAFISSALRAHSVVGVDDVYPNGFAYAAISATLIDFTGISVRTLLNVLYPLATVLLIAPAWCFFKELLGSRRGAALAVVLLCLQPEFLFVVLRGSHERWLRGAMFVMLWALARSLRWGNDPRRFGLHVVLFYLAASTFVAVNVFFGLSFIMVTSLAMLGAVGIGWWRGRAAGELRLVVGRLASVTLGTAVFAVAFIFFLYPPAVHSFERFTTLAQKTAVMALTTDTGSSPYQVIFTTWISPQVYFMLSGPDYALMTCSVIVWAWYAWRWLRRHTALPAAPVLLLWLLYFSLVVQGALAMYADRAGLLGGNLEHRSFPSFAMVAVAVIAYACVQIPPSRWMAAGVCLFVGATSLSAVLKATVEPGISNQWVFDTAAEEGGALWAQQHHRGAVIWGGVGGRLRWVNGSGANTWKFSHPKASGAASYLRSPLIDIESMRLDIPLLDVHPLHRVYDNGEMQIYHRRPETPYER